MSCEREVHVGDIGTTYKARVFDNCLPYDPTEATIKRLIFQLPGGVVLVKDATVEAEGSPADSWLLTYQVGEGDGEDGSPPSEFHAAPGFVKIQVYLEWADGSKYSSNVVSSDENGHTLKIYKNLETE